MINFQIYHCYVFLIIAIESYRNKLYQKNNVNYTGRILPGFGRKLQIIEKRECAVQSVKNIDFLPFLCRYLIGIPQD